MSFDDGDGGSYSPGPHHHHSYSPSPNHHRMPSPSHFEPQPIPLYAPPYPIIAPFPPGRDLDHRRPRSTYSRPSSSSNPRSRSRHSPDKQRRSRSRSHSSDRDRHHKAKEDKLEKAKHTLSSSFSHTSSGLGVGVLGAIVGGLAAREASEHVGHDSNSHHKGKKTNTHQQLISTIVGAAVGGLGANAIEKRLEVSRRKTGKAQEEWERKFGDERERDVETARGGLVGGRERRGSRGSRYYESDSDSERGGRRRSGERRR